MNTEKMTEKRKVLLQCSALTNEAVIKAKNVYMFFAIRGASHGLSFDEFDQFCCSAALDTLTREYEAVNELLATIGEKLDMPQISTLTSLVYVSAKSETVH